MSKKSNSCSLFFKIKRKKASKGAFAKIVLVIYEKVL